MAIVKTFMRQPVKISLLHEKHAPSLIKQELYMVDNSRHKNNLLMYFVNETNVYKAIIFSATKRNAGKLANFLRDNGHAAAPLHGDLKQSVRNRTLEQLRRGKIQYLVATDVAARGIDVLDISHIINYDLPRFSEDYVHRIGRTGRAGKSGTAISFAVPADRKNLHSIERYIGKSLPRHTIAGLEPLER
jgi:superfamily II DNA/RNA helicase